MRFPSRHIAHGMASGRGSPLVGGHSFERHLPWEHGRSGRAARLRLASCPAPQSLAPCPLDIRGRLPSSRLRDWDSVSRAFRYYAAIRLLSSLHRFFLSSSAITNHSHGRRPRDLPGQDTETSDQRRLLYTRGLSVSRPASVGLRGREPAHPTTCACSELHLRSVWSFSFRLPSGRPSRAYPCLMIEIIDAPFSRDLHPLFQRHARRNLTLRARALTRAPRERGSRRGRPYVGVRSPRLIAGCACRTPRRAMRSRTLSWGRAARGMGSLGARGSRAGPARARRGAGAGPGGRLRLRGRLHDLGLRLRFALPGEREVEAGAPRRRVDGHSAAVLPGAALQDGGPEPGAALLVRGDEGLEQPRLHRLRDRWPRVLDEQAQLGAGPTCPGGDSTALLSHG